MRSPKFAIKSKELKAVINAARLRSRWREKVRDAMRTQPIPDALEHLDSHISLDALTEALESQLMSGAYVPKTPIRVLVEKSKGLCRQIVIPSVRDALVLQTLSDAIWDELRKHAPTSNAFYAPNDQRFSTAIKGHVNEYGPVQAWLDFQKEILGFTDRKNFIVVTDISNYYDSIGHDHLRNTISGLINVKEQSLDLMIHALSHMLWQPDYMPRVAIGLPQMNLDAPRLLAHSFLFEIDELVSNSFRVEYARYMDDIDMGVDSYPAAKRALRDLDLALQTRQIRLNSGKTKILKSEEAVKHFRIRENRIISSVYDLISNRAILPSAVLKEKKWFKCAIERGLQRGSFLDGSGSKILKRLINISKEFNIEISDECFKKIIYEYPDVRQNILIWWQSTGFALKKAEIILHYIRDKHIVDQITYIQIATCIVNMRIKRSLPVDNIIDKIIESIEPTDPWLLFARLWLLSKFGKPVDIMRLVEESVPIWVSHEPLSRLVGSMYARLPAAQVKKLTNIIYTESAAEARSVLDFHERLSSEISAYTAIAKFLKAPNNSLPNLISHSKFLMLCSALSNPSISPTATSVLRKLHALSLSDEHYVTFAP
jgi:hypothetical protein